MANTSFPILVINMASSVDRLKDVSSQLQEVGLDFSRIDAVVGRDLGSQQLDKVYDRKANQYHFHRDLTLGEIGCYLSHRKAWQHILDVNADFGLIVEDDLDIQANIIGATDLVRRASGWDMIKINDTENVTPAETRELTDDFTLLSYHKVPNRAMAYFLSRDAASKLLNREKIFRPVDVDFQCYSEFGISVCGLTPNCVEMSEEFGRPEKSDIAKMNKGRHSGRATFWRNLKYRLGMFLRRRSVSYDVSRFKIEK